jgi:arsenate reductase
MAEGYLRFYANGKVEAHSAGLKNTDLHPYTIRVMEEDNIDMGSHSSQSLQSYQGQQFDYLITVCQRVDEEQLNGIHYHHRVHFDVPDPSIKTGTDAEIEKEFMRVREIIKKNMLKFLGGILTDQYQAV